MSCAMAATRRPKPEIVGSLWGHFGVGGVDGFRVGGLGRCEFPGFRGESIFFLGGGFAVLGRFQGL